MRCWRIRIAIGVIFLLMFAWAACNRSQESPNQGDAKLKELEQVASEVPIPPSSIEVRRDSASTATDARIDRHFRSPHSRDQLVAFFMKELVSGGWKLSPEAFDGVNRKRFRKGEFQAIVSISEQGEYDVGYVWESSGKTR